MVLLGINNLYFLKVIWKFQIFFHFCFLQMCKITIFYNCINNNINIYMDLVKIRMQFRKCILHVYTYNISGVVSVLKFVNFLKFSIIKLFWQHIFNQSLKKLLYIKYRYFWIRCSELKVIKMLFF